MGLTKRQWIALHLWLCLTFVAVSIWHLCLNWKAFLSYFKAGISKAFALRVEWFAAVILCVIVILGTISGFGPFASLGNWRESIKHRWYEPERRGPIPDVELMTLTELARFIQDVDADTMNANLISRGIHTASGDSIIGDLASTYKMTPQQIYNIAVGRIGQGRASGGGWRGGRMEDSNEPGLRKDQSAGGPGQGIGRMTLAQYCDQMNLDKEIAIQKLKAAGIEASPQMMIREIADALGVHPSAIRRIIGL